MSFERMGKALSPNEIALDMGSKRQRRARERAQGKFGVEIDHQLPKSKENLRVIGEMLASHGLQVGQTFTTDNGKEWRAIEAYVPPKNRQCYFIGMDLLQNLHISVEDMVDTLMGLEEMGLNKLPYPVVDIKFHADELLRFMDRNTGEELRDTSFGEEMHVLLVGVGSQSPHLLLEMAGKCWIDLSDYLQGSPGSNQPDRVDFYRDLLVVLLATKGVEKTAVRNPMAAMGIGKKSKREHVYTTTLKIRWEDVVRGPGDPKGPRAGMRTHLRCGHIRRQRYGPKREAVKRLWIEPVIVNGDPDFVSKREAYNVSKREDANTSSKPVLPVLDLQGDDRTSGDVADGGATPSRLTMDAAVSTATRRW